MATAEVIAFGGGMAMVKGEAVGAGDGALRGINVDKLAFFGDGEGWHGGP